HLAILATSPGRRERVGVTRLPWIGILRRGTNSRHSRKLVVGYDCSGVTGGNHILCLPVRHVSRLAAWQKAITTRGSLKSANFHGYSKECGGRVIPPTRAIRQRSSGCRRRRSQRTQDASRQTQAAPRRGWSPCSSR